MLFSWPLGRPFPFKAWRRLFLLPGQIISARQGVKPKKRRCLPLPDTSGVINPSPGIATKIDGRNG
ncbi:hypothetical protein [Rhizobium sp. 1399]|jgi:hypothetical protein|uniref:hypothetical protein n=1 Tax=Rhizobium sp. 1399 TaxID=2817758 RepID=UPI00285612D3|nr:hypothetical protein [Rhizobium sp. 1399]MDR6669115.1 hypothetical protein [Rhizobium sp. 1399]